MLLQLGWSVQKVEAHTREQGEDLICAWPSHGERARWRASSQMLYGIPHMPFSSLRA
jgi:hypothetical protein